MVKILVIEDEATVRSNIEEILTLSDYEAIAAANGMSALQLLEKIQPDLILCDVMMPEMDGHTVLQTVRQNLSTATIPFIFLTAKADRRDVREGMEAGADDYLTKPFTAAELLRAVSVQLNKQALTETQTQSRLDEWRHSINRALPHELNTPLNGILCATDLLLHDRDLLSDEETVEILELIRTSARRMHRLTQNALLYMDLEMQSQARNRTPELLTLQSSTCTVQPLLRQVVSQQMERYDRAQDFHLTLQDCSVSLPSDKLEKILYELLDNAFKFSDSGTLVQVAGQPEGAFYRIEIRDHGRGMSPRQIAQLGAYTQFERYLYEQQGLGLGLTIVQKLVELYGGKIRLASELGQYTQVTLQLPIELPSKGSG